MQVCHLGEYVYKSIVLICSTIHVFHEAFYRHLMRDEIEKYDM